jgi:hypothetical protein
VSVCVGSGNLSLTILCNLHILVGAPHRITY